MKALSELNIVFIKFLCPFQVSAINAIAIVIMFAIAKKNTGIENSIPTKTRTVNVSSFYESPTVQWYNRGQVLKELGQELTVSMD